jgi:predicted RNase H-like HicB family nuclease
VPAVRVRTRRYVVFGKELFRDCSVLLDRNQQSSLGRRTAGTCVWHSCRATYNCAWALTITKSSFTARTWVAEIPALGGCYALMDTREAALAELQHVFDLIAQEHQDRGQALPKDTTEIVHA